MTRKKIKTIGQKITKFLFINRDYILTIFLNIYLFFFTVGVYLEKPFDLTFFIYTFLNFLIFNLLKNVVDFLYNQWFKKPF
jgi:hypothetical protein